MLALLASLVASLGLLAQVGGTKLIHHAQHERCLANIARLELDLGLREPSLREMTPSEAAAKWSQSLSQTVKATWYSDLLKPPDDMARQIKAQRNESVRIAKAAMSRTYQG